MLVHGLGVGGAETIFAALARHLRAHGDTLEIGCLGEVGVIGEELRRDGVSVVLYPRRAGFDRMLPRRLADRVRGGGFQVIHLHQRTALFYGLLAGLLHATPIAYTEHGPSQDDVRLRRRIFNRLLRWRASTITAVSHDTARSLRVEGFAGRHIEIVHNGVDVERFAAAPCERGTVRRSSGLPGEGLVIGSVGRLEPVKNQQLLIRTLALLRRRIGDARLAIVGDGPDRPALEQLARALGVAGAVHFLGERRDIERVLPALDALALPSLAEGLPLVLLEAMAARAPVVATAVGGVPEVVHAEREALLIDGPPPDGTTAGEPAGQRYVERFAAALERLARDRALRTRLSDAAFARVQDFAIEPICRRYRDILRATASPPPPRRGGSETRPYGFAARRM
jgi:glycosyltransferase involved in cell wall biosynthesis